MGSTEEYLTARDGTRLLVRRWPTTAGGPPWASVLLIHGIGEHSGRYEHVGDRMVAAGIDVSAYDHRGMGGSGGARSRSIVIPKGSAALSSWRLSEPSASRSFGTALRSNEMCSP